MQKALREAAKGIGRTSPNPAVGAVIVRDGRITARGWHRKAGEAHAEIEALRALKSPGDARGATLYVTLEPCSTHGRTPPCVDALIEAGFRRVVIGATDSNPRHRGRAVDRLKSAGISVTTGILAEECTALNPGFNKWIATRMPYVVAKMAVSLDGRLARPPGESRWLTGPAARADAHQLRARMDGILIGGGTLRSDNPRLTVRGIPGAPQPWRIIVSRSGVLPGEAHVFNDRHKERTLVFVGKSLRTVLRDLARREITSVMIEGGMRVLGEAFDSRLVDAVQIYLAPLLCCGPVVAVGGTGVAKSAQAPRIVEPIYRKIGEDICLTGGLAYPSQQ